MYYNPLPLLIFGTGLYLLFKLRFFFVLHPLRSFGLAINKLKDERTRHSLFLALAGTLGVGNIFGVAVGIILGGAGSVFWLLFSSLFSSVLKYSEVALAQHCHDDRRVGPAFTGAIKSAFLRHGSLFSAIYSMCTLILALVMGGAMQSRAATGVSAEYFGVPHILVSLVLCTLLFIAVVGGRERISRVTSVIVPLSTVIYLLISIIAVSKNIDRISEVIALIFDSAFSADSAAGGILAFLFSSSVREGFSRGMLSNEAGAGTSSSAHICDKDATPGVSGLMGIIEVFFDTVLLCTLTAFVILTSDAYGSSHDGIILVYRSFEASLGSFSGLPLSLSVFIFAYSTVICWYYYGYEAAHALFGSAGKRLFLPVFIVFCLFGYTLSDFPLVVTTDLTMLVLSCICCFTLIKSSDRIKALSEQSGLLKLKKLK